MTHPAQARRLRLERFTENDDLAGVAAMREAAEQHSHDPRWRRATVSAHQAVCGRTLGHPDVEDCRCLNCGAWLPPCSP